MNQDILDNFDDSSHTNNRWFIRIGLVIFATIIVFFAIEYLRNKLPRNLYEHEEIQINTVGLFLMLVLIVNSVIITSLLNHIKPKISLIKTVIYTGVILISIELLFKAAQIIVYDEIITSASILAYLKSAIFLGIIGAAISNVRAHKLAGKKRTFPILIMLIIFIIIPKIANYLA